MVDALAHHSRRARRRRSACARGDRLDRLGLPVWGRPPRLGCLLTGRLHARADLLPHRAPHGLVPRHRAVPAAMPG